MEVRGQAGPEGSPDDSKTRRLPPLSVLIASLREQIPRLVRGERALLRAELGERRQRLTTGSIMLVMMLLVGFFGFAAVVAAGVVAVAIVFPAWLSALLIAAVLLLAATILVLVGSRKMRTTDDAH